MNLRSKITWSILLLILFFGSLASISTYYLTKKEFTTQVTKDLHSLGSLPPDSQAELASTQAYATAEFEKLDYDVLMDIINQGFDSSKIIEIQDVHDNRDELVAIGKVKDFPYYIIFEGDMNKINEVSIKSSIIIAGFVLITAILSVIIILFVVQIFLNQQQTIAKNLLEKNQ